MTYIKPTNKSLSIIGLQIMFQIKLVFIINNTINYFGLFLIVHNEAMQLSMHAEKHANL